MCSYVGGEGGEARQGEAQNSLFAWDQGSLRFQGRGGGNLPHFPPTLWCLGPSIHCG